ncbi:MAG: hypothetical protein MUC49_00510 [Raineya sp.]|jgi:hypothetical protein|nr:hypothetical protein [Raineya sp.]
MNWINDIIQYNSIKIFEYPSVQEFCFLRLYDAQSLLGKDVNILQGEQETLAAKGFKNISPDIDELSIIDKPVIKNIPHYRDDKYKLIGISLTSNKSSQAYKHLQNFVNQASAKEIFLVQKFFPDFKQKFLDKLKSENTLETSTKILKYIYENQFETEINGFIVELSRKGLETIDLIVLAELQSHFANQTVTKTTYKNLSARDLIINILENFENAVIKITNPKERYGGKTSNSQRKPKSIIKIEDEYDVQDILYVIFKSVFPNIKYENPLAKFGGTSTRLDFVLVEEGIIIEVKQISESEISDKKFISQIKVDIESYHVLDYLNEIIFFVFAPKAIQDINSFMELEGERTIQEKTFNVKVIVVR